MNPQRQPSDIAARHVRGGAWARLMRWLRNVPVEDAVDRRNAPMLQAILLLIGFSAPLLAVLRWRRDWHIGINVSVELGAMLALALVWTCFYLVRVGYFRLAASLLIASSLAAIALAYAADGLKPQLIHQVMHAFPLVLGGLLLGRRALWWILLSLCVSVGMGAWHDHAATLGIPALRGEVIGNVARSLLAFVVLALILDRAVSALRESLLTATRHGEELARTRDRLEREILEKERSQAQLLHAQKMEAVGRLAGGVAHDFNNVLGVILGYASRPDASLDLAAADASLAGIRAAAKRGAMVTRRLLSLSRDDERHVGIFDATAVVRDTVPMMRQLFSDQVQLGTHLPATPMPVRLDRGELELALLNIAANARDAMPGGGSFRVNVERQYAPATASTAATDVVAITLTDTGAGMTSAVVERMFDPFFTTKAPGQGTGIGLAVVHRLVTDAGGELRVDSEPGRGTALRLVFPLVAEQPATPPRRQLRTLRVLLVEDDSELRGLIQEALQSQGCEVLAAASLRAAEAHARRAGRIDAIVSDFNLPDGDADTLFTRLAPVLPEAHRLLMSAHEDAGSRSRARGLSLHTLAKPFTSAQLLQTLADVTGCEPPDEARQIRR